MATIPNNFTATRHLFPGIPYSNKILSCSWPDGEVSHGALEDSISITLLLQSIQIFVIHSSVFPFRQASTIYVAIRGPIINLS